PRRIRSSTYPTSREMLMIIMCANFNGSDHTSTNTPDPIRTPQLSVLGQDSTYPTSRKMLMIIMCANFNRCDHTSTNAPDPIRTP
ncbi:hypothetical protein HN51_040492, partial [Arachis hypogaea]